jgi:hypothetical protein
LTYYWFKNVIVLKEIPFLLLPPVSLALGFEADTIPRKWTVRMFNTMNYHYAKIFDKTIRIAIHPNDFQLLLAQDLEKVLNGRIGGRRIGSQTLNCELATKGPTPITQFKIQQV